MDLHREDAAHNVRHRHLSSSAEQKEIISAEVLGEDQSKISIWPFIALSVLCVCGGPYGDEDTIADGGPIYAILAPLLVGVCFTLPIALMTAELVTAIPHDGGYILWVYRAFGPFWGFQAGFWSFISSLFLSCTFPVMVTDYIGYSWELTDAETYTIRLVVLVIVFVLNYSGSNPVGHAAIGFSIIGLLPFVILLFFVIPFLDFNYLGRTSSTVKLGSVLYVAMFNQIGIESVSLVAGEIANPAANFPRVLRYTIIIVISLFTLCAIIATGVVDFPDYSVWTDGFWVQAAKLITADTVGGDGTWFQYWVSISAAIVMVGETTVAILCGARGVYILAVLGMIPAIFAKVHDQHHTPWVALVFLSSFQILVTLIGDFDQLMTVNVAFYAAGILLRIPAFLYLRVYEPDLPRPYKVPGSWTWVVLLSITCFCITVAGFVVAFYDEIAVCAALALAAIAIYFGLALAQEKGIFNFVNDPELLKKVGAMPGFYERIPTDELGDEGEGERLLPANGRLMSDDEENPFDDDPNL